VRNEFSRPRVIHEHVEPAEGLLRLGDHGPTIIILGNVGLYDDGFGTPALAFSGRFFRAFKRVGVVHDNGATLIREEMGGGAANTRRGASDEGGFALELHELDSPRGSDGKQA
jgi:hypothetical protein